MIVSLLFKVLLGLSLFTFIFFCFAHISLYRRFACSSVTNVVWMFFCLFACWVLNVYHKVGKTTTTTTTKCRPRLKKKKETKLAHSLFLAVKQIHFSVVSSFFFVYQKYPISYHNFCLFILSRSYAFYFLLFPFAKIYVYFNMNGTSSSK